jgi:hypothetical protein
LTLIGYDERMPPHQPTARVTFILGMIVFVLGELVMCYCPWMFVIATVLFSISWLLAVPGRLRMFALIFFAISVLGAIYEQAAKQNFQDNVMKLRQRIEQESNHGTVETP